MIVDLFNAPVLPGLSQRVDATGLAPFRCQGWEGKRLTTSFGWSYDFEVGQPKEAPPFRVGFYLSAIARRRSPGSYPTNWSRRC